MQPSPLTRTTLVCYSAGSVVETSLHAFCGLYLMNFYTDVVHLDPRLIGYAFGIRFWIDALADPAIGYVSDRTRSSFGRRKPYLLLGVVPAVAAFYLLLSPPDGSDPQKFAYLAVVSSIMILGLSVFGIPYIAMSWELTPDYHERTRISVYRRVFEVGAEILATLMIPVLLALAATSAAGTAEEAHLYPTAALLLGAMAIVATLVAFQGTPTDGISGAVPTAGFIKGLIAAGRNRPFIILLATFTLVAVADRVATSLLFYILEYWHGVPKQDAITLFLAFFAGSLMSPPIWLFVSRHTGKKVAYILAMFCWGVAFSSFVASAWSTTVLHLIVGIMGAASSGVLILPGAIAPDVIEWDQLRTGERHEGTYAGVVRFTWEFGTGATFFLVGHLLHAIGYVGEAAPTPSVVSGLRLIFVVVPSLLLLAAMVNFSRFPISPQAYQSMREQVERMQTFQDDE